MNSYGNIEAILMKMRTAQEQIITAEKKVDEYFKKVIPFMNRVHTDVVIASGGAIPNGVDFVDPTTISVSDEATFVSTMAKIRWMPSYVQKIRAYIVALQKLNDLKKSAQAKIDKLDKRIKYMDAHSDGRSADYVASMNLRSRNRDGLVVVCRRMEVVAMNLLKTRAKVLEIVGNATMEMCNIVDDCGAIAKCALRNDDSYGMSRIEMFNNIVKKGMREND